MFKEDKNMKKRQEMKEKRKEKFQRKKCFENDTKCNKKNKNGVKRVFLKMKIIKFEVIKKVGNL